MTSRFQVVPAAYVIFRRTVPDGAGTGEQVLLQLRRNTGFMDGYWAMAAAGHVEAGESVLQAACREAAEELGVSLTSDDLVPVTAVHRTQGNGRAIDERVDFFFECRRWSGRPTVVEPDKTAQLDWFGLDALPEPLVPHERAVLARLRQGPVPAILAFGFN